MKYKKHLTQEGIQRIMSIRGMMNNKVYVNSYTNYILKIDKPILPKIKVTDITLEWLVGFIDAEGCFYINIRENRNKGGYSVSPVFSIVQHSRDLILFKLIKEFLGYGNLVEENKREVVRLRVENSNLINQKLIPLFIKYPLQSYKLLNYIDFCKACKLIKDKAHISKEGIIKLKEIKSGMNTGRK
jgi:LAGLIDADG endonuclease